MNGDKTTPSEIVYVGVETFVKQKEKRKEREEREEGEASLRWGLVE